VSDDRVAFFDEQRRNRRAAWRLAAASTLGVLAMGVPVSLVITPLVYGAILIVAEVLNLVHPFPAAVTQPIAAAIDLLRAALDSDGRHAGPPLPLTQLTMLAAAAVVPGMTVMLVLWLSVRSAAQAGAGRLLQALHARELRATDFEETQLRNIVEEMAIAAGLPPPGVRVIDVSSANAAIVGSCERDAVLVVSRGLLDDFSRDETQAVVAHLVGSAGNGDLKIAADLDAVFESPGRLTAFLDAQAGTTGAADDNPGWRTPLMLASQSVKWTLFLCTAIFVGPLLALLWRARRHLADATAVQLTRNPESLWEALAHAYRSDGVIDGSAPASYLFIVGPQGVDDKMGTNSFVVFHPPIGTRLRRIECEGATSRSARGGSTEPWPRRIVSAFGRAVVGALVGIGLAPGGAGMVIFVGLSVVIDLLAATLIHEAFGVLAVITHMILG
jgi:Zn-dependent protease with chaperone function